MILLAFELRVDIYVYPLIINEEKKKSKTDGEVLSLTDSRVTPNSQEYLPVRNAGGFVYVARNKL